MVFLASDEPGSRHQRADRTSIPKSSNQLPGFYHCAAGDTARFTIRVPSFHDRASSILRLERHTGFEYAGSERTFHPVLPSLDHSQRIEPVLATRDDTRGAGTTIPAAATERISRPPAEPEPKKPALGEVHLASPTMNRTAAAQEGGAEAPTLANGADVPNVGGLDSNIGAGNGKQPAAPEVPLPVGGDVQSARLISKVDPYYPVLAKNQHVAGDVKVDALIDANGRVTTMKVISGPTLLHQAAMDALRQCEVPTGVPLDGKPDESDAPDGHAAVSPAIVPSSL